MNELFGVHQMAREESKGTLINQFINQVFEVYQMAGEVSKGVPTPTMHLRYFKLLTGKVMDTIQHMFGNGWQCKELLMIIGSCSPPARGPRAG